MQQKSPRLAVDCVVFDAQDRLLLIRRRHAPFAGQFALPGGFVEYGETTAAAACRELCEETGIRAEGVRLVGVYSRPDRDPRGHTVSVAYAATLSQSPQPKPGSDAESAEWIANWRELRLAFDHARIIADAEKLAGQ